MNRYRGIATPAGRRRTPQAPAGSGTAALLTPLVVAAVLLLCGCGSAAYVKIDGVETSDRKILGPIQPGTAGKPQLSFCVTKGLLSNRYRSRNGSVRDDAYYQAHLADLLRRDAPFESIETVQGSVEGRACDIVLVPCTNIYVSPEGRIEASLAVTALTGDMQKTLLAASVRDEDGVEAAGARIGRVVYNAFVPGSALYDRVVAGRRTGPGPVEQAARRDRGMPVRPPLPEPSGQ